MEKKYRSSNQQPYIRSQDAMFLTEARRATTNASKHRQLGVARRPAQAIISNQPSRPIQCAKLAKPIVDSARVEAEAKLLAMLQSPNPLGVRMCSDKNINGSEPVLQAMMTKQKLSSSADYSSFHRINEECRRKAVDWIEQVCFECETQMHVFPLSVSYLDRFLTSEQIYAHQIYCLAGVCIWVASKMKMPKPISLKELVKLSPGDMDHGSFLSWELLLLGRLNWDMNSVLADDFFDHYMERMKISNTATADALIRKARLLMPLIVKEYCFSFLEASSQAALCLAVVARYFYTTLGISSIEKPTYELVGQYSLYDVQELMFSTFENLLNIPREVLTEKVHYAYCQIMVIPHHTPDAGIITRENRRCCQYGRAFPPVPDFVASLSRRNLAANILCKSNTKPMVKKSPQSLLTEALLHASTAPLPSQNFSTSMSYPANNQSLLGSGCNSDGSSYSLSNSSDYGNNQQSNLILNAHDPMHELMDLLNESNTQNIMDSW